MSVSGHLSVLLWTAWWCFFLSPHSDFVWHWMSFERLTLRYTHTHTHFSLQFRINCIISGVNSLLTIKITAVTSKNMAKCVRFSMTNWLKFCAHFAWPIEIPNFIDVLWQSLELFAMTIHILQVMRCAAAYRFHREHKPWSAVLVCVFA